MAREERFWIQEAIKRPGRLRAYVARVYGDKGFTARGTIRREVLEEIARHENRSLAQAARLALRLREFRRNPVLEGISLGAARTAISVAVAGGLGYYLAREGVLGPQAQLYAWEIHRRFMGLFGVQVSECPERGAPQGCQWVLPPAQGGEVKYRRCQLICVAPEHKRPCLPGEDPARDDCVPVSGVEPHRPAPPIGF